MKYVILVLGVFLADACELAAQSASDEAQIRAARAASNEAIARHDVAGILLTLEDAGLSSKGEELL